MRTRIAQALETCSTTEEKMPVWHPLTASADVFNSGEADVGIINLVEHRTPVDPVSYRSDSHPGDLAHGSIGPTPLEANEPDIFQYFYVFSNVNSVIYALWTSPLMHKYIILNQGLWAFSECSLRHWVVPEWLPSTCQEHVFYSQKQYYKQQLNMLKRKPYEMGLKSYIVRFRLQTNY